MPELDQRARDFVRTGAGDETALLIDCVDSGRLDALRAVQLLFEDMYGGTTYNYELKAPAAWCLPRWGEAGLAALVESADRSPTSKNRSLTLEVLTTLAADAAATAKLPFVPEVLASRLREFFARSFGLREIAGQMLRSYVLSTDDDVLLSVGTQLHTHVLTDESRIAETLIQAVAGRWLAVRTPTLEAYDRLVREHQHDERLFQSFFEQHPLLIDPMASDVFPQPDIAGAKEPDFLIRRSDDSFLVVEIETPAKPLMTQSGKLSAEAAHAVAQVTDYAEFLMERVAVVRHHLPSFRRPDGLVVIGTQLGLTEIQARGLRLDNESRHRVTIVGFDWIGERARSILRSVVSGGISVTSGLRVT